MATSSDLMGLGMPAAWARILANTPVSVSLGGTTVADATIKFNGDTKYVKSQGGTVLVIGSVGGNGPLLGDLLYFQNNSGGAVVLYAQNPGSTDIKICGSAVSVSGQLGVSIADQRMIQVLIAGPATVIYTSVLN